jgi:DNA-binding ferritin-like protein
VGSRDYLLYGCDEMTDILEQLRSGSSGNAPWEPEYKVPPTALHLKAAAEIESLRQQLAECQAKNAKLAERVVGVGEIAINSISRQSLTECQARQGKPQSAAVVCLLTTELDTMKKQWQREALLKVANEFGDSEVKAILEHEAKELE